MKDKLFNHIPPLMIGVVLLFWAFGPAKLLVQPATLVATSALIVIG